MRMSEDGCVVVVGPGADPDSSTRVSMLVAHEFTRLKAVERC